MSTITSSERHITGEWCPLANTTDKRAPVTCIHDVTWPRYHLTAATAAKGGLAPAASLLRWPTDGRPSIAGRAIGRTVAHVVASDWIRKKNIKSRHRWADKRLWYLSGIVVLLCWAMARDKDSGTAAIYREPMPPRKTCTSYHVFKILSIIYAVIFFVSIDSARVPLFCHCLDVLLLSDCRVTQQYMRSNSSSLTSLWRPRTATVARW